MNYRVKIEDRVFEVEIIDIHARPVVAVVDGVEIEVWPQETPIHKPKAAPPAAVSRHPLTEASEKKPNGLKPEPSGMKEDQTLRAPIPGTIITVNVREGDKIEPGQDVCTLEAMKMKNIIRSPRGGKIAQVHVLPGQSVQHQDALIEFEQSG